jgi:hypothetical protein
MLESILRRSSPSSTAYASTSGALEADACPGGEAVEMEFIHEYILPPGVASLLWEELDWCLLTLLWANETATAGCLRLALPHPDAKLLTSNPMVGDYWHQEIVKGREAGFVMGREAVTRAVAQWDPSKDT